MRSTRSAHSLILASALLLVGGACAQRNIHRDLRENDEVLLRRWTLQTRNWLESDSGDRGFEFSNPVVHQNTLIFGSHEKGLISIYPKLMQRRWMVPIPQGVQSEILIDHGSVYFGGGDGFLYSVDAETGRINWQYELRNPQISKPVVDSNRLFVTTTDDTVYGFDAATGKWLWHYRRRTAQTATVRGASSPVVDGRQLFAGLSDGYLVSLGVEDGQLKWEKRLHPGTKFMDVDAPVLMDESRIYVPAYDGSLFCLKKNDGEVIWKIDAGGARSILLDDSRLIFPSTDGFVYALDKKSGKQLWKFELDGGVPTDVVAADRYWIVASSAQYFYALDRMTGEGVYRFNAGWDSGFNGPPAFDPATHRIYALSSAGNLYSWLIRKPLKTMAALVPQSQAPLELKR